MTQDPFRNADDLLMKIFKSRREKTIPPKLMQGFSASVEARIRLKENPQAKRAPQRILWPQWAPVLAVLIMGVAIVLRYSMLPTQENQSLQPTTKISAGRHWRIGVGGLSTQLVIANVSTSLADEMDILSEVGAWTEEDEEPLLT